MPRQIKMIAALVVAFILLVSLSCWSKTVSQYETAATQNIFTGSVNGPYEQGFHIVPFVTWESYQTRRQQVPDGEQADRVEVLTADQLRLIVEASYWYRVEDDAAVQLYLERGDSESVHNFVYDAYRNATRDAVSEIAAQDLLSEDRQGLGARIEQLLRDKLEGTGVEVTRYFLRDIDPPDKVKMAIEEKLSRQQEVQTEEYQTQVVQEKANQRREKARGVRDAQNIIAESLEGERGLRYLNWRYYEVLQKAATGKNNLIIANQEMPMILDPSALANQR